MEDILTNNFDDYTCIKYLDDNCVSTTFKIPSVEDIIRLSVCSGDVLCIANKTDLHSQPYVTTNKPKRNVFKPMFIADHDDKDFGTKGMRFFAANSEPQEI